jgi:hypothetical protein
MQKHNPYAPSSASLRQREHLGPSDEVRRDGKWVVMSPDAALPARCVKCNGEVDEPTKLRTVYWHHGAIYLLLLVNLLIFLIVALAVRKKAVIAPGMCLEHKRSRRNAILYAWLGILFAFVTPFVFASSEYLGMVVMFSVVVFVTVIVYGMTKGRIVYAKRIDKDEVRLGGCGEEYLDSLPGS